LDRLAAVFRVLNPWQRQAAFQQALDQQDNNNGRCIAIVIKTIVI
jgi:hypothetical protein